MINYLYKFEIDSEVFAMTSSETSFTLEGVTYEPAVISHEGLKYQSSFVKSQLNVNIQLNHALAVALKQSSGYELVKFTLIRVKDSDIQILWHGTLIGRSFENQTTMKLKIGDIISSIARGERRRFSSNSCNHVLYSKQCGAVKTAINGTSVAFNNGAPLMLVSVPDTNIDKDYVGGILEIDGHSRYITNCVNAGPNGTDPTKDIYIVYLDKKVPTYLDSPAYIDFLTKLYKGCPKTIEVCNSRFSNKDNFGGQPQLPLNNPFATTQYL